MLNPSNINRTRVLELLRAVREPDKDFAEIAERLVPGARDYLHSWDLEHLVRDDLPVEVARREVQRQKEFVGRLVDLLPTFLGYFELKTERDVLKIVNLIDDCCHDFPIIKSGARRDHALRDAVSTVERAEEAVGQAVAALSALDRVEVLFDVDHFLDGYLEKIGDKSSRQSFNTFREHLRLRHDILKICVVRAKSEDDYLFVSNNQVKTHVVEAAYTISRWHGGPRLVTTPGSEFSFVCGLLYEIVAGKTNESLAGVINRFARSRERHEFDEHDLENERYAAMSDTDNFFSLKEEALRGRG